MTGHERVRQFSRYILTGGTAALVDLFLFWCATRAGMPILPAAALSFSLSSIVNYLLTTRITFRRAPSLPNYLTFVVVAIVGLTINTGVTVALVHLGLLPLIAKIGATGVAFIANFAMNATFVFRDRPQRARVQ